MDVVATRWDVELDLSERDGRTRAEARLVTGRAQPLTAHGTARLAPEDPVDVAEIGYELAAARALRQLGDQLLDIAQRDVAALSEP